MDGLTFFFMFAIGFLIEDFPYSVSSTVTSSFLWMLPDVVIIDFSKSKERRRNFIDSKSENWILTHETNTIVVQNSVFFDLRFF